MCSTNSASDIWLFTSDLWLTPPRRWRIRPRTKYRAIRADPTIVGDFAPYLSAACKIVGSSADAAIVAALRSRDAAGIGVQRPRPSDRKAIISTSPRPRLRQRPPSFQAIAKRQGHFGPMRSPPSGDMQNDLAMFKNSGVSIAMGKRHRRCQENWRRIVTGRQTRAKAFAGAVRYYFEK